MSTILSVDLRKRVIDAITIDKMRITTAAKLYKISRRVIYKWFVLLEETKSLAPKTGYQKGRTPKVTDWEKFKDFAKNSQQRTAKEMADEWEKLTSVAMSKSAMARSLKKIGYTFKKKPLITRKQIKKNDRNF